MARQFAAKTGGGGQQLINKGDSGMLLISDDVAMMNQIRDTHVPDGRVYDVMALLRIVEDILLSVIQQADVSSTRSEMEDPAHQSNLNAVLDALSYTIDRVAVELSYKTMSGTDALTITVAIFSLLSCFQWDAIIVLTLAAFALNYGEFWLATQSNQSTNLLAKSLATPKQLPAGYTSPEPNFDAVNNLIRVTLDLSRSILEFNELPTQYISEELTAFTEAVAHIPTAAYWTVRSVVASASQITSLMGNINSVTELWELSTLAYKLKKINEHMRKQLATCHQYIDEKRIMEVYPELLNLFATLQNDNMKALNALITFTDDVLPLFYGTTTKRAHLDVLRGKNVLLLISGLDISHDQLSTLVQIYKECRVHASTVLENQYEVVWIPVVDRSVQWTGLLQKQFESLQTSMPWYTVTSPSLVENVVIKFFIEEWRFRNKPIIVLLDPHGSVMLSVWEFNKVVEIVGRFWKNLRVPGNFPENG